MPYSKYFKVLGLSENASQDEIRKRYRELVKIYHPDVNSDPSAAQLFIDINAAYIQLTENADKLDSWRNNYTTHPEQRKSNPTYSKKQTKNTSKEEIIKQARIKYKRKLEKMKEDEKKYYTSLISSKKWLIFKISAYVSLVLSLTIMADQFLPKRFEQDKIIAFNNDATDIINDENAIHSNFDKVLVKTKNNHRYFLKDDDLNYRGIYTFLPTILIEQTYIYHFPLQVYSFEYNQCKIYKIHFTFGQTSFWVAIVLIIPFLTLLYKRNDAVFIIFMYISLYIINGLVIYILVSQNRLIHLITLGNY